MILRASRDRSATDLIRPLEWLGDRVRLLDQTALPSEERYVDYRTPEELVGAIRRLEVRGAPLLGVVAGFGMALAAVGSGSKDARGLRRDLEAAAGILMGSRPTAVNITWAVGRILSLVESSPAAGPEAIRRMAVDEAECMATEDAASCRAIGGFGAELVPDEANVLTHCNTGALATAGIGTALGVIRTAHERGKRVHVWVDETRPLWQGARLTAWELRALGIPMTLIADAAAGSIMAGGSIDLIVVGADRIAANGDVANKVGTYPLAVLAKHHGVPFYVAAPVSTVDLGARTGDDIAIERRNPDEISNPFGLRIAPEGTWAVNPAFDVTPSKLVSAIVTDRGIARAPYRTSLRRMLAGSR